MLEQTAREENIVFNLVNAKIESTMLGFEDHGIMTLFLHLDYGGSGQGAGGFALCDPVQYEGKHIRVGTAKGMDLIMRILNVVGVKKWEDLPGKYIRAYASQAYVGAIYNIVEDKGIWFKDHFKESPLH